MRNPARATALNTQLGDHVGTGRRPHGDAARDGLRYPRLVLHGHLHVAAGCDPIPITVAPRGYVQVAMQDQTRILKTVPHSVTVRASAGPTWSPSRVFSAVAPASPGFAPALGAPLQATRWYFADGAVAGTSAHSLVLFNPSVDATARVSVAVLAGGQLTPIDRLQQVELPAAGRLQVDVAPLVNRPDASLVIDSTAPVVAEQSMATATAIAWSTGMPAAETTTVPAEVVATTTTTSTLPASAAS